MHDPENKYNTTKTLWGSEENTSFKNSQENCKEITNAINAWDLYIRSLDGASYIVIRNGSIAFVWYQCKFRSTSDLYNW